MSLGFVDPTFFETIRVGSAQSLPEWVRKPLAAGDVLNDSVARQAFQKKDQTGFAPRVFQKNMVALIYFSEANVRWCQQKMVQAVFQVTRRTIGLPDHDNVVQLLMTVWDEALALSFVQNQPTHAVLRTVSLLNRYVIQRARDDMLIGIRAQSGYIQDVSEAPTYDDPKLTSLYVGGTKASMGTLSNSSVLPDAGSVQAFSNVSSTPSWRQTLKGMDESLF